MYKRKYSIGSIEKRGENSYRFIVQINGERYTQPIKIPKMTKRKRVDLLNRELDKYIDSIFADHAKRENSSKFSEFTEMWLKLIKNSIGIITWEKYESTVRNHLNPYFKDDYLSDIGKLEIKVFENYLLTGDSRKDGKEGPLSAVSVLDIHRLMYHIFNDAVAWEKLDKNPMKNMKAPRCVQEESDAYDIDEVENLLQILQDQPLTWKLLVYLPLFGSLRRGEVLGINIKDIDFERNTISINQSYVLSREKGPILKETKGKRTRVIRLPQFVMDACKEKIKENQMNKVKNGLHWDNSGPLFPGDDYVSRMYPTTPSAIWEKIRNRNDLRKLTYHELRHTSASLLLRYGIDLPSVSYTLGHASVKITSDVYSHVLDSGLEKISNIFDKFDPKLAENKK